MGFFDWFKPRPKPTPVVKPPNTSDLLVLHNKERAHYHMAPLTLHQYLIKLAQSHANDMWFYGDTSHFGWDRRFYKMTENGFWSAAENVISGYPTSEAAIQAWKNSWTHHENILGDYDHIGIGVKGNYICCIFASQEIVRED